MAAELGLKQDTSIADAVTDGNESTFTCGEYREAHDNFGPSLSDYASYRCSFSKDAFQELDADHYFNK